MKVLISALGAIMGGAMRHLTNFLPELARQDPGRDYVVLVRESFPELAVAPNVRLERVPDRLAAGWLERLYGDLLELPRKLRRERFGCMVSLTNFGPIRCPVPHLFFQRNPLYYCHYYLDRVPTWRRLEALARQRLAVASMQRADLIVTPSRAMADMIRDTCPQVKDRAFATLYHGFAEASLGGTPDPRYEAMLARPGVRLLYPTHPAPHKGFEVLFPALALLKQALPDFTLFTTIARADWPAVVAPYERQIRDLGLQNNVIFTGRIPQQQMGAFYRRCHLMVYPSLCESFGFSMVEAMGTGLPIVAAGTAVNREMCGDAALYYDPLDPVAAAEQVALALVPEVAEGLRRQGRRRLEGFDWGWPRYTREFLGLVARVAG